MTSPATYVVTCGDDDEPYRVVLTPSTDGWTATVERRLRPLLAEWEKDVDSEAKATGAVPPAPAAAPGGSAPATAK